MRVLLFVLVSFDPLGAPDSALREPPDLDVAIGHAWLDFVGEIAAFRLRV